MISINLKKKLVFVLFLVVLFLTLLLNNFLSKEENTMIPLKEVDFNQKIKIKKNNLFLIKHQKKMKLLKIIFDQWPDFLYIEELSITDEKVTIKGFTDCVDQLDLINKDLNYNFIIQSVNAHKAGWLYSCDTWLS
jgi:hypothetical protein